ncbi:hypothetical protein [Candidatus Nitrosotenuis uzonensis]|uniref:YtkA-like domain-containing protein n=1 Tax=Candidatus Nitrosotenuis uzonensis TaxID=1407055 RepID=V6ASX7_9ARCH|nr:hypothetical protein [Candidatus Nitrosotenuis uzonensis]CDI05742.1 exported hypothetical protein [Candidatus Nitrosotenuis uzonensis]
MSKLLLLFSVALISIGLLYGAYAHKSEVVDDYKIQVGWVKEPPIAGMKNAIEITVTKATASDKEMANSHDHVSHDKSQSHEDHSAHTNHVVAKNIDGVSGLNKSLEVDVVLNDKKTFLRLVESKTNKGTYYGVYVPDSSGYPLVHVVGKIKNTPMEITFHPEKVEVN